MLASGASLVALAVASWRKKRAFSKWTILSAIAASAVLIAMYLAVFRQNADWIVGLLSTLPAVVSPIALWCGRKRTNPSD